MGRRGAKPPHWPESPLKLEERRREKKRKNMGEEEEEERLEEGEME